MQKKLTQKQLFQAAKEFCIAESLVNMPELIGVTDGKAVGTFVEHRLKQYLSARFDVTIGSSASGIDLPDAHVNTDIKVTSIKQPQSSCPYKSSRQKIFGLGYNLLVLVYDKQDTADSCHLKFAHCTLIDSSRTADFTTVRQLHEKLAAGANKDDILAFFEDKHLPGDSISLGALADEVMEQSIEQGYLTISNALQWRLQYSRVIALANSVDGVYNFDFSD